MTTLHSETQEDSGFLQRVEDPQQSMLDVAKSRAAQEVQAKMVIAKRFPRSEALAYSRIMEACKRKGLAEEAAYSYPRGGQTVSGPSIRLAETLARCWGNMDFGMVELERSEGSSTMLAYAWDLETNTCASRVFTTQHIREKKGGNVELSDPRDIYELTANQGARRVRACILAIIPGDIVDSALEACTNTLKGDGKVPLIDRVKQMVVAFEEMGVTAQMVEKRLGHVLDKTSESELVGLRRIFKTIKDNFKAKEDFFETSPVASSTPKTPDTTKGAPTQQQPVNTLPSESKPSGPKDELYDPEKPLDSITAMMKRDGVTSEQVVHHAKAKGLASKTVEKVSDIREANIKKLCETWATQIVEIKAIPAGE